MHVGSACEVLQGPPALPSSVTYQLCDPQRQRVDGHPMDATNQAPSGTGDIVSGVADPLQLLTVQEVASLLRVQKWFVYDQIKRGDLVAVKLGRSLRTRRDDLDAFVSRLPQT